MNATMRAAVAVRVDAPLELRELPIPRPGPGQALVKLRASGVCHTDIHMIGSHWPGKKPSFPLVPGHEGCGHVAAVGDGVDTVREGDAVGVFWLNHSCGHCEFCVSGRENICPRQVGTGYTVDGTYAEYCLASADFVVPLPKGGSELHEYAPILCAGVTSYKAIKELEAKPSSTVVVSGVGGAGHLAIQYARVMGFEVIAIDVEDHKLDLAKRLGAFLTLNAKKVAPVNRVLHDTGGGAHGVLVCAVETKAFEQGLRMLRRAGTCVLVGVPPEPLQLAVSDMILRELTVRGSVAGTRQDLREALALVGRGLVKPIVETFSLENVNEAMTAIRSRRAQGRVVLTMDS